MNLPVAFEQLRKMVRRLEESARDSVGIWEQEDDEESDNYGEMKKVADRDGMERDELLGMQEEFLFYAEWVREVLDNLGDPWRERSKDDATKVEQVAK